MVGHLKLSQGDSTVLGEPAFNDFPLVTTSYIRDHQTFARHSSTVRRFTDAVSSQSPVTDNRQQLVSTTDNSQSPPSRQHVNDSVHRSCLHLAASSEACLAQCGKEMDQVCGLNKNTDEYKWFNNQCILKECNPDFKKVKDCNCDSSDYPANQIF